MPNTLFDFSLLMAINKRGYENVAERGGYGEGGFRERGAVTLDIKGIHLFSLLKEASTLILLDFFVVFL